MELFIKYCEHADKETGLTFANPKTCAEAFGMRSDNAQKYDKELIEKGWIRLVESNGKICRKVEAGWRSTSQRGQGKAENARLLNFRKELEKILNFREFSYILGNSPKFKEKLLNFRKTYKEYIDQHTNQLLDQLTDQTNACDVQATSSGDADSDEANRDGKLERSESKEVRLPINFTITDEMREWAKKKTPAVEIESQTEEFVNFWCHIATKNNRRTMRGWVATWQSRMREMQTRFEEKNGTNAKRKAADEGGGYNGENSDDTLASIRRGIEASRG